MRTLNILLLVFIMFITMLCLIELRRIELSLVDYRPCRAQITHLKYDVVVSPGTKFSIYDCDSRQIGGEWAEEAEDSEFEYQQQQ